MASNLHYWIDVITLPSQTKSISNLLGYQHLILEAHMYLGEVWYVYDHHLSHIAYTCLPNFLYLLAFGHRRVVTNKMYPWQAGNADPTASTALTSSIHQQCSGLPEPPCFIQKRTALMPDSTSQTISCEWNYLQCFYFFQVLSSSMPAWSVTTTHSTHFQRIATTNSLISKQSQFIECQSVARSHDPSNGDTTPVSTLKIIIV